MNGSVSANILNEQIQAAVTLPLNAVIDMTTLNGYIDLEIPVNTSTVMSASVGVGTITTQNLFINNMVSTSTFLSGTLGNGQATIQLESKQIGNMEFSRSINRHMQQRNRALSPVINSHSVRL